MTQLWQVQVASDVGRDALTVEISYSGELWAVVLDDGHDKSLRLQTFPRSSPTRKTDAWEFDLAEAQAQLERARTELRP